MKKSKEILRPIDIAQILEMSPTYVRRLINEKRIPAMEIGYREKFISRQAFFDWTYFTCMYNQKQLLQELGIDFKEAMFIIAAMKNQKDQTELELIKITKNVVKKLRQRYADKLPPDPNMIESLEAVLDKIEVFQPIEEAS